MRNAPRAGTGGHKRKARGHAGAKPARTYRVTGTWPGGRRPAQYEAADRPAARKLARQWAADGAVAVIEEHVQYGTYRTMQTIDGPALAADRAAAENAAQDAADARVRAALAARAQERRDAVRAARDRAQAAALMVQPPVPRAASQRTARHTAGER